ncbi:MIC25 protein, partial [Centropus bengalensis]|nr:MIC25 protein [Centropus bengalensis]
LQLTEDVVNRMRDSPQSRGESERSPLSSNGTAPPSSAAEGEPKPPKPPTGTVSASRKEQALVQEELLRLAKRESEAANEALNTALQRERDNANEERQRAAQLVSNKAPALELQDKEAELKRQEAFYKEQLARIEKK